MTDHRKYMRFIAEFEVEIIDPTAAAAYTMDWGRDEAGNPEMQPYTTVEDQMRAAVSQAFSEGMADHGPRAGFKWWSGSVHTRPLDNAGENHIELDLPSMPARRDDGTYPDEP